MFEQQQNNFAPYGMNMMGAQQQPTNYRIPNTLSAEDIKMLQNQGSTFSLGLTDEEVKRAICNHRSADGLSDTLVVDPITGIAKCQICGYEFKPLDSNIDYDEIKEDIKRVEDILQTAKLMYIDLPAEAAKEFYPIIAMLEKVPKFIELAAKNMAKHDSYNYYLNDRNIGAAAVLNNLNNMFSNMAMNYQPQQPMYGMYNQPAGFPQGAYAQPQMNPFGYNGVAPAPAYTPGTPNNFAYQPNQQVAPAPAAPTATQAPVADATVTQTVQV